jgi:putative FMN-dependent luciferase-like monooxygenase
VGEEHATPRIFRRDRVLQTLAREMRRDMTPAERRLCRGLRSRALGVPFRRQHAIPPYIADFACLDARLIVEVDGGQHGAERDAARDAALRYAGWHVLRFWNDEVVRNLDGVLSRIQEALQTADTRVLFPHPNPPPLAGEGVGRPHDRPHTLGDASQDTPGMTASPAPKRLGFFTRLLDEGSPAERYRLATAQIQHAERLGYDTAWVAQHHFHEGEGGLPSPFVFLAQVAAVTSRIRLGTGIVTLSMEQPIRAAEDAAVLDLLSGGRLELGVGSGGNPAAFAAFGMQDSERREAFDRHLTLLRDALAGGSLPGGDRLYPARPALLDRLWYATFSVHGARAAGRLGAGLLLSRTQPRTAEAPGATLSDIQDPMVDAYLEALPPGTPPRILASRSVLAADDRAEALRLSAAGLRRFQDRLVAGGRAPAGETAVEDMIRRQDAHVGTPEEVLASLRADRILDRATELAVQVHSMDPPHAHILRSIELVAERVAPALGWSRSVPEPTRRVA